MAYQKTNWVDGETLVNAERMNNIENGIANLENEKVGQKILWELGTGKTSLSNGNIALSSSDYNYIEIEYLLYFGNEPMWQNMKASGKLPYQVGKRMMLGSYSMPGDYSQVPQFFGRHCEFINKTTLYFDTGRIYNNGYTSDINACVPIRVLGYK